MKEAVKITENGNRMVEDLCDAYARLVISPKGDAESAYIALQMRKIELAKYIGGIERINRIPQIVKVFDILQATKVT